MGDITDEQLRELFKKFNDHVQEAQMYRDQVEEFMKDSLSERRKHTRAIQALSDNTNELIELMQNYRAGKKMFTAVSKVAIWITSVIGASAALQFIYSNGVTP